jgi:hypothetical protein
LTPRENAVAAEWALAALEHAVAPPLQAPRARRLLGTCLGLVEAGALRLPGIGHHDVLLDRLSDHRDPDPDPDRDHDRDPDHDPDHDRDPDRDPDPDHDRDPDHDHDRDHDRSQPARITAAFMTCS